MSIPKSFVPDKPTAIAPSSFIPDTNPDVKGIDMNQVSQLRASGGVGGSRGYDPTRIDFFRRQAEEAETRAEEAGGFGAFAKELGKTAFEFTGLPQTGRRIAAGIAPFVVPKEELPDVVEELVGGVTTPQPGKIGEFFEIAADLPLVSLGLSKTISGFLTQAGKKVTPDLIKLFDRPLLDFVSPKVKNLFKKDVPVGEGIEKGKEVIEAGVEKLKGFVIKTPEQHKKEISDITGKIIQGKTKDIPRATKALGEVDTQGIKTYKELNTRISDRTTALKNELDKFLDEQASKQGPLKLKDLNVVTEVGETKVKQNFVKRAITQLKELHKKTLDSVGLAKITNLEKKLNSEGLDVKEINNLAREYGREFKQKAFTKTGDAKTSVSAEAFENTRKGLKTTARDKIEGLVPKTLDSKMSILLDTQRKTAQMEEKVNQLFQKVKKRGFFEKLTRKLADVFDVVTLHTVSGFAKRMLIQSNIGVKSMNAIDIEEALAKNLSKLDKLIKTKSDDELLNGIVEFLKKPTAGLSIEDVSGKIVTDPVEIQKLKNSIDEGKNLLSAGVDSLGNKLTPEKRSMIRKSILNAQKKIGEGLKIKDFTVEDVTPAGFGPTP